MRSLIEVAVCEFAQLSVFRSSLLGLRVKRAIQHRTGALHSPRSTNIRKEAVGKRAPGHVSCPLLASSYFPNLESSLTEKQKVYETGSNK
jgi:hypothetical protein